MLKLRKDKRRPDDYGKNKRGIGGIKKECEALNTKLKELTEDELKLVTGGIDDVDMGQAYVPQTPSITRISDCEFTSNPTVPQGGAIYPDNVSSPEAAAATKK